jgi:hypothetical protein
LRRIGRVPALAVVARVTGHALAAVQRFHRPGGQTHIELLSLRRRARCSSAHDLDVVVDIDDRLPSASSAPPAAIPAGLSSSVNRSSRGNALLKRIG